jgi:hypothetical protein
MEVLVIGPAGMVTHRVRLRDRVAATLHADSIDRRLADGGSPEADVAAAVRSRSLTGPRQRRLLACGIERAIDGAQRGTPRPFAHWDRVQVLDALAEMYALRDLLDADGVPPASGIARARELLTDPRGPLFDRASAHTLRESLRAVLATFDPA